MPDFVGHGARRAEALQRGQYLSNRYNTTRVQKEFDEAVAAFHEALRLDPSLAQAAAELAAIHIMVLEAGASPGSTLQEIARWADMAVGIDPRNGGGWTARAFVEMAKPWPDVARVRECALRRAALTPRNALAQNALGINGRLGNTLHIATAREAARLDPLYIGAASVAAYQMYVGVPFLARHGRVDDAFRLMLTCVARGAATGS